MRRTLEVRRTSNPNSVVPAATGVPRITLHNLHHNAAATPEMAVALLMAAAKFNHIGLEMGYRRVESGPLMRS